MNTGMDEDDSLLQGSSEAATLAPQAPPSGLRRRHGPWTPVLASGLAYGCRAAPINISEQFRSAPRTWRPRCDRIECGISSSAALKRMIDTVAQVANAAETRGLHAVAATEGPRQIL
jgi:hypothetical protein